ncbi:MAG TPA: nicotinate phosphoribosyltransferase [Acidimicrobiales bacterium]|nr:nicotinate phosphoribosyltransferase [Acidimicrobiales bacterium]
MLVRQGDGLFTDLYELTMAASYHQRGLDTPATFDLFVRSLPSTRRFLLACGVDPALDFLEELHFEPAALRYLESLELFDPSFLERLSELRFTGEVWAVPEGEAAFAGEPLLRVTAPLVEAQVVETALLNLMAHSTMVASKAARVALACGDRRFVDFSPRRDHGPDAALLGARAAFIGGAAGTSLVAAGSAFGLPVNGTMAHSYVTRFASEREAFVAFARSFPDGCTLLIDTYDTERAARLVVEVSRELAPEGATVGAVRIDSGDLGQASQSVRAILDEGGLDGVRIVVSGDLDEHRIAALLARGAPIDAFGVGTQLGTSADAPSLGAVYKLVEDVDGPKAKRSAGKASLPGCKQVWRVRGEDGRYARDVLALASEWVAEAEPVLERVMAGGERCQPVLALPEAQERGRATLAALPDELRSLEPGGKAYPVETSGSLVTLAEQVWARHA